MIFFGETSLHRAVTNYLEHYHVERNPQGLGNEIIEPGDEVGAVAEKIECCERLGGLLNYYYCDAAQPPVEHVQLQSRSRYAPMQKSPVNSDSVRESVRRFGGESIRWSYSKWVELAVIRVF